MRAQGRQTPPGRIRKRGSGLLLGGERAPLATDYLTSAIMLFKAVGEDMATVRTRHEVEVALVRWIERRMNLISFIEATFPSKIEVEI